MKKPDTPWTVQKSKKFDKQVRALPYAVQKKLSVVMTDMIWHENPTQLGIMKKTVYGPAFVTELDDSYRLAYLVDLGKRMIIIIIVGDHKGVYGTD
jgi:mRNA-degrading endonuclease RelE of RelBE toxin-antitoxin system